MRIGMVIRKFRIMTDVTVEELAKEIGTCKATLSRIERGIIWFERLFSRLTWKNAYRNRRTRFILSRRSDKGEASCDGHKRQIQGQLWPDRQRLSSTVYLRWDHKRVWLSPRCDRRAEILADQMYHHRC